MLWLTAALTPYLSPARDAGGASAAVLQATSLGRDQGKRSQPLQGQSKIHLEGESQPEAVLAMVCTEEMSRSWSWFPAPKIWGTWCLALNFVLRNYTIFNVLECFLKAYWGFLHSPPAWGMHLQPRLSKVNLLHWSFIADHGQRYLGCSKSTSFTM